MRKLLDDDDEKYLDPETNPAIRRPTENDPDPESKKGDLKKSTPKDDVENLPAKIKEKFPNQSVIGIADQIGLVVQKDGNVLIAKPKEDGSGWNYSPLKDANEEDLAIVKRFVDDKKKEDPYIDPKTNPAIPDHDDE